jgi:hypothetical protein
MKRAWVGLALLSVSWLFGLRYYHAEAWVTWTVLILVGTVLLTRVRLRAPGKAASALALALLLPSVAVAPWPYRSAPLLIVAGLALHLAPIPRRWPKTLGVAALMAGLILTAQSLAMVAYESITARSHELPHPLALVLLGLARLLGIDAALDGSDLALYSVRTVHRLGATWELLLDPPTLCFLVGGIALLWSRANHRSPIRSDTSGVPMSLRAAQRRSNLNPWGGRLLRYARNDMLWRAEGRLAIILVVLTVLWLPVRAALLMAMLLHRALHTEYDTPLALMNQFWNPWLLLVLLLVPVLLAIRFVRTSLEESTDSPESTGEMVGTAQGSQTQNAVPGAPHPTRRRVLALAFVFVGVFLLCFGLLWDPAGRHKEGRILVDEFHSTWEPTGRPFDTEWYGEESGYNYACIYDYCSRFYQMGRLTARIDEATLQNCDVLVVKVPTSRYASEEVAAIERFVKKGGGLLLIGEHTNVFDTGTHLNDIARRFGFRFRYDCVFDIDAVFEQRWQRPVVALPIVQSLPSFDFAVSCSIDPGASLGRAVIRSTGLRNLPADYHVSNFYPQVEDHAYSRYGAFVQLWTTRRGAGRVAAFTDSTVFSNFSTFEPGKAELMLGLLEWLNHRNAAPDGRLVLLLNGLVLGLAGLSGPSRILNRILDGLVFGLGGLIGSRWISKRGLKKTSAANPQSAIMSSPALTGGRNPQSPILLLALGMSAWALAVVGVRAVHRHGMPLPKPVRPFVHVVMDRTVCDTPLSKSGFLAGEANGFGIFERWILRLGCFTSRRRGPEALTGDLVVFTYPSRTVTDEFREAVVRYVAAGGKVLVVDSPENTASTANSLLYPFGLSLDSSRTLNGSVVAVGKRSPTQNPAPPATNPPGVPVEAAYKVAGGEPVITLEGTAVAATARHGQGSVTAVGFGSRWADARMGVTGDVVPDPELRRVFDLEFTLLRDILSLR